MDSRCSFTHIIYYTSTVHIIALLTHVCATQTNLHVECFVLICRPIQELTCMHTHMCIDLITCVYDVYDGQLEASINPRPPKAMASAALRYIALMPAHQTITQIEQQWIIHATCMSLFTCCCCFLFLLDKLIHGH